MADLGDDVFRVIRLGPEQLVLEEDRLRDCSREQRERRVNEHHTPPIGRRR